MMSCLFLIKSSNVTNLYPGLVLPPNGDASPFSSLSTNEIPLRTGHAILRNRPLWTAWKIWEKKFVLLETREGI